MTKDDGFVCAHCHTKFTGVEAAHHLSTHLLQKHGGLKEPTLGTPKCNATTCPALPIRVKHTCGLDNPLPIDKKANAMHLRDVAMNGIGEWIGQDLEAVYGPLHAAPGNSTWDVMFRINGKLFTLTVKECN